MSEEKQEPKPKKKTIVDLEVLQTAEHVRDFISRVGVENVFNMTHVPEKLYPWHVFYKTTSNG
jgi:hypothetical protein